MYLVTGSPVGPFSDAVLTLLRADATLTALVAGGIVMATKVRTGTTFPYVVVSRQEMGASDSAMQLEGGQVSLTVDVWSGLNGPHEVQAIQSRIKRLLQRVNLSISGYSLIQGSMTCEEELVFADGDPDIPEDALFHGVQRWSAMVEEL